MSIYAQIQNGVVTNVIIAENNVIEFLPNKNEFVLTDGTVSINSTYDGVNFIKPKPHASWTLDSNHNWQPPTPKPDGNYYWNEEELVWVAL
jgi:hypothetical protein